MPKNVYLGVDGVWTNVANWSLGAKPATGDDVYINSGSAALVGLGEAAVTLLSLTVSAAFTGSLDLVASITNGYFGVPSESGTPGAGSRMIRLNTGTNPFTGVVYSTANGTLNAGLPAFLWKGVHASNKLTVLGGRAGVGMAPGDVATLPTGIVSGGFLTYGDAVTWTTASVSGKGTFTSRSGGGTTLNIAPGCLATISGTTIVATINNDGRLVYNVRPGGNMITTLNANAGSTNDFTQNPDTGNIGTLNQRPGATWETNEANPAHITFTTWNRFGGTVEVS